MEAARERGQNGEGVALTVQDVEEYAVEISNQLFQVEAAFLPRPDYMEMQKDINCKMRTILIDWLVEVHMKYKLRPETLHLTVNLIDRFLSRTTVARKRLQLIGVVAMFIASKFEEISPPELHDWVFITDKAYTKEDVISMECTMLTTLGFQVMAPTCLHFFTILEKANACDAVQRDVAEYILELGLLDLHMLRYSPSHMVAAALLLSNELSRRSPTWPLIMVQESHFAEQALRHCADDLRRLLEQDQATAGGQLQAVHKKFSSAERHKVAKMKF
jgi:cyclin B